MSISKYNAGEPFNSSLFLYLQPEIQVRENLSSVEQTFEYYEQKKDNPDGNDDPSNWLWSLTFLPNDFDPEVFIVVQKLNLNISLLNTEIKNAKLLDGLTEDDIESKAEFVNSLGLEGRLIAPNVLQFLDEELEITPQILQVNDEIRLLRQLFFTIIFVKVTEIIDSRTIRIEHRTLALDNVDEKYEATGLRVIEKERIARINYLRTLVKNDEPPTEFSVGTLRFNPDLYRLLYPNTRSLTDEEAFLHYKERLDRIDKTFGKVDDFIRVFLGESSTDSNTSLFNEITLTNRLVLNFPENKQSGYLRFIDQDIYYITTDDQRTSSELSTGFQGLITEKAIKTYIERLIFNPPPLLRFEVEGEAIFREGFRVFNESSFEENSITNFKGLVNFQSNTVFEGDTVFKGNLNIASLENTEFRNIVEFYDWSKFFGESVFLNTVNFLNNVNLSGYTDFCINEDVGPIEGQVVHFHLPAAFFHDTWIQHNLVIRKNSTFESEIGSKSIFNGLVEFSNLTKFQKDVHVEPSCEMRFLSSNIHFDQGIQVYSNSHFTENSKTYFDGEVIVNNKIVFEGDAKFLGDLTIVSEKNTEFRNIVDFYDIIYVHGNFISNSRTDFLDNVNFSGFTDFCVNEDIGPVEGQFVHFHLPTSFFDKTTYYDHLLMEGTSLLETKEDTNTVFKGKVTFCNEDIVFKSLQLNSETHFNNSNTFFKDGFSVKSGKAHFTSNSDTLFDSQTTFHNSNVFKGPVFFLGDVEIISEENSKFRNNVEYFGWNIYHGQIVAANRCDFINNVNFSGFTDFCVNESIGPIPGQSVHFHLPTKFFDETWIVDHLLFRKKSSLLTEDGSSADFEGESSFHNKTHFKGTVHFYDTILKGNAYFEDDIEFYKNVKIDKLLETYQLNVINKSYFHDNVLLNALLTQNGKSIFNGYVEFQNPIFIYDISTFEKDVIFKNNTSFEAHNTFLETTEFIGKTSFNQIIAYETSKFNANVIFNDKTIFNHETLFNMLSTFYKIYSEDIVSILLTVHDFVNKNTALFENKVIFNDTSHIEGDVTFSNANVTFTDTCLLEFLGDLKIRGETTLLDHTIIKDNLDIKATNTLFNGCNVSFENEHLYINTQSTFNSTALFNSNIVINDKILASGKSYFQGQTYLQGKVSFDSNVKVRSSDDTSFYWKGDITFASPVYFDTSINVQEESIFWNKLWLNNTLYANESVFDGISVFNDDVHFKGSNTSIDNLYLKNVSLENEINFLTNSSTKFLSGSKLELLETDLIIDTSQFQVLQEAFFTEINTSNLNVKIGHYYDVQSFYNDINTSGLVNINQELFINSNALLNIHGNAFMQGYNTINLAEIDHLYFNQSQGSNLIIENIRVNNHLDIDKIEVDLLQVNHNSNINCFIENGQSLKHQIDDLYVQDAKIQTCEIVNNTVENLNTQDAFIHSLNSYETQAKFLESDHFNTDKAKINYARIISSSNDDAFFHKQKVDNLNCKNGFINKNEVNQLFSSNLESKHASIDSLYALHSRLDTMICTYKASFQDTFTINHNAKNIYNSNANIDLAQIREQYSQELNVINGHLSNANVINLTSDDHTNKVQHSRDLFTSNLESDYGLIHEGNIKKAHIDLLENNLQKTNKSYIQNLFSSNLEITDRFISHKESQHLGTSQFYDKTLFYDQINAHGGVNINGQLNVSGKNNKIHNIDITNSQFNQSIRFLSTPHMKNNLIVDGATYGSRIGIGPYMKKINTPSHTPTNMKNVFSFNKQSGTKVFGKRSHLQGIDGGLCVMEIQQYPNSIIHLADGISPIHISFFPLVLTPQSVGVSGRITIIERGIHGRKIQFKNNLNWIMENIKENIKNNTEDIDENKQIQKTSPSPNTFGGYSLQIYEYNVLSQDIISIRLIQENAILNDSTSDDEDIKWIFSLDSISLSIINIKSLKSFSKQNSDHNQTQVFITVYQHITSPNIPLDPVEFPNNIIRNSPEDKSYIVFYDQDSKLKNILTISDNFPRQNYSIPEHGLKINTHNHNNSFIWTVVYPFNNENYEIYPIYLYDINYKNISIPVPLNNEGLSYKKDHISLIAYHENRPTLDIHPTWFKVIRNGEIHSSALDESNNIYCIINPTTPSHYVSLEEYEPTTHELVKMEKRIEKINIPKEVDFNVNYYIVKLDHIGKIIWTIPVYTKNINGIITTPKNDMIFYGLFDTNKPLKFIDNTRNNILVKDENDRDMDCLFLSMIDYKGKSKWNIKITSETPLSKLNTILLKNNDFITSFYMDDSKHISFYDINDSVSKIINPKTTFLPSIPQNSWNYFYVITKYLPNGSIHWNSCITSVESNIKMKAINDGGILIAFVPHQNTQKNKQECVISHFDGSKAFDATSLMDKQREKLTNENIDINEKIKESILIIIKLDSFGRLVWHVQVESDNFTTRFINYDINPVFDGGFVLGVGNNIHNNLLSTNLTISSIERKIKITDASNTTKTYDNLIHVKLSSQGHLQ